MEQILDVGRLAAVFILATALALLGYSVGYQSGHAAGLQRMERQLDLLGQRQLQAVEQIESRDPPDGLKIHECGRCASR